MSRDSRTTIFPDDQTAAIDDRMAASCKSVEDAGIIVCTVSVDRNDTIAQQIFRLRFAG